MAESIVINGRFLTQPLTGVQRYAHELVKAIDRDLEDDDCPLAGCDVRIVAPHDIRTTPDLHNIPIETGGRRTGQLWEQLELPRLAGRSFLVNLCNLGPHIYRRQSVTVHDAAVFAYPATFSPAFRAWYRFSLRRLGKIASRVLTVSQFSKDELVRHARIDTERITVIYHGHEHVTAVNPDESILCKLSPEEKPYVLAVGSNNYRKNLQLVVEAAKRIGSAPFDIVVTGGANPKVFGAYEADSTESVRRLGYVTDEELRALYEHAELFVYPSLYEGFGLPALEAMACGCPVVAADIPPLREVCGEAAVYCDPHQPGQLADILKGVMGDQAKRDRLRVAGRARVSQFTWAASARATLQAIRGELNA
ncbi:glycosyltransferase [candidate division GN15 bacterium]|nr:glycosyltransferase [candidate division GN15 bacterium]